MEHDPAIHVGSIVCVKIAWWLYPGIVVKENIWEPGGYLISVPGKIGNTGKIGITVERALELCYNATEKERKLYFKNLLKYEND